MNPDELIDRLRSTEVATVLKRGVAAAELRRLADGVEFQYLRDHVERGGVPVATSLPISDQPVRTPPGAVPPFFAGLLPEGRRLQSLRRAVKASADDEFTLLLAVGRDVVGDVQVVADDVVGDWEVDSRARVDQAWDEISFSEVLDVAGVIDPIALPGVQDKTSARMISVPLERLGERYILKVDPPELRHLVENEGYFLACARRAGVDAAEAEIVHDRDGRAGLLVRRFDRVPRTDGTADALACEDGCQVLGRWPADKYNVTTEELVTGLAEPCDARRVALRTLYQQVVYSWLIGNGDVHAKNLSILMTDGEWRVSPAYDVLSTVPYGDLSTALPLTGRRRGLGRRHLLQFAAAIGLTERAARNVLDDVLVRTAPIDTEVDEGALPFDAATRHGLAKELRYRRRLAEG